jgi:hypothetical protein
VELSWAATSKSRRRIPRSIWENNIVRLPVDHVYAMNFVVLARREVDAHDNLIKVFDYEFMCQEQGQPPCGAMNLSALFNNRRLSEYDIISR